jgi:hypothetical protein
MQHVFSAGDALTSTRLNSLGSFGSDGNDGAVTISSGTTTLTRDMFYTTLTISSGATLKTAGFRVFVQDTLTNAGTIHWNGNAGTAGTLSLIHI